MLGFPNLASCFINICLASRRQNRTFAIKRRLVMRLHVGDKFFETLRFWNLRLGAQSAGQQAQEQY